MSSRGSNENDGLEGFVTTSSPKQLIPVFIKLRKDVVLQDLDDLLFSLSNHGEIEYFYDEPNEQFAVLAQVSPLAIDKVYRSKRLVSRAYQGRIPKSTLHEWSDILRNGAEQYHKLLHEYPNSLGNPSNQ